MDVDAAPVRFCILTPCLNYVELLDQTVLSVLTQEGDFTLHYHVQDGGSTDGTLERLTFWQDLANSGRLPGAGRGVRFTVASEPDRGLYDAINRGIAALPGGNSDMITWINASDLLVPGALAAVARFLRQCPETDWVCGRRAAITDDGFPFFIDEEMHGYPRRTLAAGLHVGRSFQWIQPEGMFWRRRLWAKAGGGVDATLRLAGDFDLWRRFGLYAEPVVLDRVTGVYRFHANRLSSDIDRYYAEVDAVLARHGLLDIARTTEAAFIELAGCGDVAGLRAHGFTARTACCSGDDQKDGWSIVDALPDVMPGWTALARRLSGGTSGLRR